MIGEYRHKITGERFQLWSADGRSRPTRRMHVLPTDPNHPRYGKLHTFTQRELEAQSPKSPQIQSPQIDYQHKELTA